MINILKQIIRSATIVSGLLLFIMVSCNQGTGDKNITIPKTDTIFIDQMKFIPSEITIPRGDTVLFINKDIVAHNVTEVNKSWRSPILNSGDSWRLVPEKEADYFCSIHIVMKGKIIVK